MQLRTILKEFFLPMLLIGVPSALAYLVAPIASGDTYAFFAFIPVLIIAFLLSTLCCFLYRDHSIKVFVYPMLIGLGGVLAVTFAVGRLHYHASQLMYSFLFATLPLPLGSLLVARLILLYKSYKKEGHLNDSL